MHLCSRETRSFFAKLPLQGVQFCLGAAQLKLEQLPLADPKESTQNDHPSPSHDLSDNLSA